MAKYDVRYACGHEGTVTLFGPTRDRERKLEWLSSSKCKACEEAAAAAKVLKETQDRDLPELVGTQKQVDWAMSIRISQICALEKRSDRLAELVDEGEWNTKQYEEEENAEKLEKAQKRLEKRKQSLAECQDALECLYGIREARWWIDHRNDTEEGLISAYRELGEMEKEKAIVEEERSKMVIAEPEATKTETVATIEARGGSILMTSDKDETIRLAVKAAGFSWDSDRRAWVKEITEMTGPEKDLLPDTARRLLESGVRVKMEPWVRDALVSGSYEPECNRWIMKSKDAGKVFIMHAEGVNLPAGCKTTWDGDGIISADRWREIREFAELNGYKITQRAGAMLKAAEDATVKIKVADKTGTTGNAQEALAAILESSRDILEDLKEED